MSGEPKVSVIIIFLNAAKFIDEAIQSVFAQTYSNWELLLVDDGSTDISTEIAWNYAKQFSERVKYLDHHGHRNRGMSATRNLGIRHARGKYIAFLDADDVWLPRKLEQQVAILESEPTVALVCGASLYWYSWTGVSEDIKRDYVCDLGVQPDMAFEPPGLFKLLLENGGSPCPSDLLIRREVFSRIGGFEESFTGKCQLYEDQAFLAKLFLKEEVFVANDCWSKYRIHPDSCDSIVTMSGEHDNVRLFFLNWLEEYLSNEEIKDPQIWSTLRYAFEPYRNLELNEKSKGDLAWDSNMRRMNWWLRLGQGSLAKLEFLPDEQGGVRIAIDRAGRGISHDIQLNMSRLRVQADHRYVVTFLARSDSSRTIFFGFAKGHTPWSNLGLYSQIALTKEWQSFERSFVALADVQNARIHFDVGEADISVELAAIMLRSPQEDRCIEPDLPLQTSGRRSGGIE